MILWRPYKRHSLLISPFLADGATPSGILAIHDARKMPGLALVLDTNDCSACEPGDTILFDEGRQEAVLTAEGETFAVLEEARVLDVLE